MKKTLLTTCNAKYIHKNLALRWLYVTCPQQAMVEIKEYTIKDDVCKIVADILRRDVAVVCFSCYIWNIDITLEIIASLKAKAPTVHVIIGGPEVSFESYDLLNQGVDAISIGEGEKNLWEYILSLDQARRLIKGMYTKAFPDKTYMRNDIAWLETFEDPYFLPFDQADMDKRYFYLETSRGCPYGCTYCLSSQDRCVRMFSDTYVCHLLDKIAKSNIKQVKLLDRTFNCDPKRALMIARYMNQHCHKQIFQFEIVAETLSDALLQFFLEEADPKRFRFEIGVQSFYKPTLQSVGRLQNNERLKQVLTLLHQAGFTIHADLIAGLPYEDIHQFELSFNTLFALGAGEVQLGILKLLKGTKLRSQQAEFHMQYQIQAPYTIQSTKWISKEEMKRIVHAAQAVEKFWNSGTCCYSIQQILQLKWYQSAFALFLDLGEAYAKLARPYQPHQLFQCFQQILADKNEALNALLLMDYYPRFKQKPHRFCNMMLDHAMRKTLLDFALVKGIANQDQLYRYGVVDMAYHEGEYGYQLVLYTSAQIYPKQYFINQMITTIKEI